MVSLANRALAYGAPAATHATNCGACRPGCRLFTDRAKLAHSFVVFIAQPSPSDSPTASGIVELASQSAQRQASMFRRHSLRQRRAARSVEKSLLRHVKGQLSLFTIIAYFMEALGAIGGVTIKQRVKPFVYTSDYPGIDGELKPDSL